MEPFQGLAICIALVAPLYGYIVSEWISDLNCNVL